MLTPDPRPQQCGQRPAVILLCAALLAGCGAEPDAPAVEPVPAEPAAESVAFETAADAELEAAILAASPDYTREIVGLGGNDGRARYLYSRIDLDGDGADEAFVYLLGSIFCGTGGCNLQIFTRGDDGYALVSDFPITRTPVVVAPASTNGWRDIWRLRSGGGAPANYIANRFDGTSYIEQEEVPADQAPDGTRVLTGEVTFERGIILEPRD